MLRLALYLTLVFLVTAANARASEKTAIIPSLADCVRADTTVCTFRLVSTADLGAGTTAFFPAPSGFPRIDHVELQRIDDDLLVLVEYFVHDPALQGVAF